MRTRQLALAAGVALLVAACGGPPADEEPLIIFPTFTPTPATFPQPGSATAQPPAQPGPGDSTPSPPGASSGEAQEPTRISFAPGAISATVTGQVGANEIDEYVLYALGGQTMTATLTTSGGAAFLSIAGLGDGIPLVRASAGATTWTGELPVSQDYSVKVVSAGSASSYSLEIVIPPLEATAPEACSFRVAASLTAYVDPDERSAIFGTLQPGDEFEALARTEDGWFGFDPGVAQAGNTGLDRLRWIKPAQGDVTFDQPCDNLEVVSP